MNEKIIKRFWSKVKISSENNCWNFEVPPYHRYGLFIYQINKKKVSIAAHRFSYILKHGEFEKSLYVLHKCDNPACVNPEHLFLGTQLDNMKDMYAKGRDCKTKGTQVKNFDPKPLSHRTNLSKAGRKVTDEFIAYVKELVTEGMSYQAVGRYLKCSAMHVRKLYLNLYLYQKAA